MKTELNTQYSHLAQASLIELQVLKGESYGGMHECEPVTVGVPFASGKTWAANDLLLLNDEGQIVPSQKQVLASWPDGSIKWLSVMFLHSGDSDNLEPYSVAVNDVDAGLQLTSAINVNRSGESVDVDTVDGRFTLTQGSENLFDHKTASGPSWLSNQGCQLICTDAKGKEHSAIIQAIEIESSGPLQSKLRVQGSFQGLRALRFSGTLTFFAGINRAKIELTLENPARAKHSGGYWDLGDPASVLVQDVSLCIHSTLHENRQVTWTESPGKEVHSTDSKTLEIYQDSSGGENWQSRNHLNRKNEIPISFQGYRVREDQNERIGGRAHPVVSLNSGNRYATCTLTDFWEKFPSSLEVSGSQLRARLLPGQFSDLHEIQPGEHLTRTAWLEFGEDEGSPCSRLAWVHNPITACCDAESLALSRAIPFLPQVSTPVRESCQAIFDEALEGDRNFFAKREVIDEYGWRNFGDLWADHEEAYCNEHRPVISHYNNQYDALYGFSIQYLISGDRRWKQLANPLAEHLLDIDIYHSQHDKSGYSGGMFWHSAHYHDAGTSSHRCMSRRMQGKEHPAPGGGPGNEHNYASGLLLHYYLSGDTRFRDVVIRLADWVIAMDDGQQHTLGLALPAPTGAATATTMESYHGPGRGTGNSIHTLLDGWLASGDEKYLEIAEALIRRTIHPQDDIQSLDLGNAELRWSYTVHLQSLGRFLELTTDDSSRKEFRSYVRESLLHYARWMVANEKFYLDTPDELEFPTETWAAQELRKGNVLLLAASLTEEAEGASFHIKGREILDKAWDSLSEFPTKNYSRPMVLVLQQQYIERFYQGQVESSKSKVSNEAESYDFGTPQTFIPQKQQLKSAIKSPQLLICCLRLLRPWAWKTPIQRSWFSQRCRTWLESIGVQ